MTEYGYNRTEIVEVELIASKNQYKFGRLETLSSTKITGIVVHPQGSRALDTGNIIADTSNAYLRLLTNDNEIAYEFKASNLLAVDGTPPLLQMVPLIDLQNVDWEKSELVFAPGSPVLADTSFQMLVSYER